MFKDTLKENRLKLGLSQEELAAKIFVSRAAVGKWEQGRGLPADESVQRLAVLFGMPADELLSKADMVEAVQESEKESNINRKKAWISIAVAGVSVVALATTLLCGCFIYQPSGEETSKLCTLSSAEKKDDRLIAIDCGKQGRFNYSQWEKAQIRDEYGQVCSDITELNLRQGDQVELSYLADRNWFGQDRIGASGLGEIALKAHSFLASDALCGVGYSIKNETEGASFGEDADNVAYARFYESGPDSTYPTMAWASKNLYDFQTKLALGRTTITMVIAIDPSAITNSLAYPYFQRNDQVWTRRYFDMAYGTTTSSYGIATGILGKFVTTMVGALPLKSVNCGYQTVTYDVTLMSKENPTMYQVKSYDSTGFYLGAVAVVPGTILWRLNLSEARAYSIVEEYQGNTLLSTSEKISKDSPYCFTFANQAGFFDCQGRTVNL